MSNIYRVDPPSSTNTRSDGDVVNSGGRRTLSPREAARRHRGPTSDVHPVIATLRRTWHARSGKTAVQTYPPYSIHSSKLKVRQAMKAWRKQMLGEYKEGKASG